jgi:hypothetical protein
MPILIWGLRGWPFEELFVPAKRATTSLCKSGIQTWRHPNKNATGVAQHASWDIFEGLVNDWNIVQLVPGKDNDNKEIQSIHRIVLDAKIELLCVQEEKIGAFRTEDPEWDGYILVKWMSQAYRLKEAHKLTEYNPPILVPKGELVANGGYFNQVPWAPRTHQQIF